MDGFRSPNKETKHLGGLSQSLILLLRRSWKKMTHNWHPTQGGESSKDMQHSRHTCTMKVSQSDRQSFLCTHIQSVIHTLSHSQSDSQSQKKKHQAGKASSVGTHTEHKQADRVGTQETGNDSRRKRLLQIERRYRWASIRNKVGGWVWWGRV